MTRTTQLQPPSRRPSPFGTVLQHWRQVRRMSQLALAIEAEVSPRHICFIETGRAQPSRDMVLLLARALDVPLRERNVLLLAAGYAPMYRETNLESPELGAVRAALQAILRQQEPYPAVVMNRSWDILTSNDAASRFFGWLLDPAPASGPANVPGQANASVPTNVIRMMFDPHGLRPFVLNWEAVAEALITRVHREAVGGAPDAATVQLLDEVLAFPGVPRCWQRPSPETPLMPVIPVTFKKGAKTFAYFSTVTTLGTAQDVTLQELRIECFFPMDAATERNAKDLAMVNGGSGKSRARAHR
jgi:transcriptional regulator with XRE-family HTH domain